MNLPNKLTIVRICLVPVFVACFYLPFDWWNIVAAAVFVVAYLTDMLDGAYARKHNMVTEFGKLMDPIADKMLSCSALIMLTATGSISPVASIIIVSREFIISGFRLVAVKSGVVIAANILGKLKTVFQFVAISLILLENPIFSLLQIPFDQIVLWASVVLAIWSAADYIIKNVKKINLL